MQTTIKVKDIVIHQLSKILFRCENGKHEKWMNMNPYYQKTPLTKIEYGEWYNQFTKKGS